MFTSSADAQDYLASLIDQHMPMASADQIRGTVMGLLNSYIADRESRLAALSVQPRKDSSMPTDYAQLGREIGHRIGSQIADKLGAHIDRLQAEQKPFTFRGGVGLAKFNATQATAFADPKHFQLISEYACEAANLTAAGLSLSGYVHQRLAEEYGVGFGRGYESIIDPDFLAAVDLQSKLFAEKFPVRSLWGSLSA